ncbi:Ltp family lipoprotein [Listeria welshimeri]|uniref:Ltp family lipoprotein n=1 Tax=Listeria welshimeri TaxID=1643 RepID=UPI001E2E6619|nr:Ltp family lipoprotein [Listeria welshimeri]
MGTFLIIIGFLGMIGSFVYLIICLIKKKKKKIASFSILGAFVIMILGAALFPPVEDETAKADKEEINNKIEKKKEIEFTVENSTIDTDDYGKAVVKGTVDPDAKLMVNGEELTKDTKGAFTYDVSLENKFDYSKEITISASKKGYEDTNYIVTILNKTREYKEKIAKEEAAQKAADEKEAEKAKVAAEKAEKEAAERKAIEEEEARKEAAAQKEKERLGAEGESALIKAQSYSDMMQMSKAGIYDQLTSEYGEKFSPEAAQYAVDNIEADFNINALGKAKDYQETMSMSPEAIRDQLTSEYGEKFTPSEANYAITHLND